MSLKYLSGTNIGRLSKSERKEKRKKRRAEGKGFLRKVATVTLASSRVAFLGAARINFLKLSTRLAKLYKQNPEAFNSFWLKFGGKPSELKEVVSKGSKEALNGNLGIAAEAAIAAALPIITVLVKILRENKIPEEVNADEQDAAIKAMQTSLSENPEITKDFAEMPEGGTVGLVKADAKGGLLSKIMKGKQDTNTDTNADSNKSYMMPLLIGGAALFLLSKK